MLYNSLSQIKEANSLVFRLKKGNLNYNEFYVCNTITDATQIVTSSIITGSELHEVAFSLKHGIKLFFDIEYFTECVPNDEHFLAVFEQIYKCGKIFMAGNGFPFEFKRADMLTASAVRLVDKLPSHIGQTYKNSYRHLHFSRVCFVNQT